MQASVNANLNDGTSEDATLATSWTTYRSSNPNVVVIDGDGLVLGVEAGTAFITATNDSAASVRQVVVSSVDAPLTELTGFVAIEETGELVPNAVVEAVGTPFSGLTDFSGRFSIPNVDGSVFPQLQLVVALDSTSPGVPLLATKVVEPSSEPFTDVGILSLGAPAQGLSMRMFDDGSQWQSFFEAAAIETFTWNTVSGPIEVVTAPVPLLHFPDIGIDTQAFYCVGDNGTFEGLSAFQPQGDDVSFVAPGGSGAFGALIEGYLLIEEPGLINFTLGLDDDCRLQLGDEIVFDWDRGNYSTTSATYNATYAGFHPIKIGFQDTGSESNLVLFAEGGGFPGGVIPSSFFAQAPVSQ